MLKSIYTGIFLVSLILISCTGHPVLDEVSSIPSEGWKSDDRISYDFPISDTSKAYDIFFHIRNMQHYSYSNIWLFVEITAPNSFVRRDTFEIMLADKAGRWYGKGIGNINSMLVPYAEEIKFAYSGIYKISLQHGMRENVLENLLDIGVRVQQHQY